MHRTSVVFTTTTAIRQRRRDNNADVLRVCVLIFGHLARDLAKLLSVDR